MINKKLCEVPYFKSKSFFKFFGIMGIFLFLLGINDIKAENNYAQTKRLTLELANTTMKDIFREIEQTSEYIFFYSDEVNVNKKTAVHVNNQTIHEVMSQILEDTGYTYVVSDRQIFIKKSEEKDGKATQEVQAVQQNKAISGKVVDKNNEPIIGANIMVKGTTMGTITDFNGSFSLNVPANAVLQVTYIGYESKEIAIGNNNSFNIELKEDSQMMDEVVVVGYGTQKRVNLTGAVSTVNTESITGRTNSNLLQSLQGTAPGVTIISRPGKTPSINIRGRGNLGTSEPLYVIDGAISTATSFSNLDPNSIESVSILKDAASSAIYGSRAAYGVVLINTKQSKGNDFQINYDGYVGFKQLTYKPKVVNSEWEALLTNEAAKNAGRSIPVSDEVIQKYRTGSDPDLYPNTDWYDLIFDDNAVMTNHTVSFSGGTEKLKYYSSLGYTYDDAFQPGESTDRYNLNMNVSGQIKPWLKLRTGVKYTEYILDKSTGDANIAHIMQSPPSYVSRQSTGEYGTVHGGGDASSTFVTRNPLRALEQGGWTKRNHKTTVLDGALDITLYEGLVLTGQIISDNFDYKNKKYEAFLPGVPRFRDNGASTVGEVKDSKMEYEWYERRRMSYNAFLNYEWSKDAHTIKAMLASTFETYKYQQQKSYRKNFPSNSMEGMDGGSDAPADSEAWGDMTEDKLLSYFGRINYNYLERYLFEVNFRADGSSRFPSKDRWGYFPSFSAGWRISEEAFMKNLTWIDNLKIRASWGQLGNINNVGHYDYFYAYAIGKDYRYSLGGNPITSIFESKIPSKSLTWETVTMTDIGFDMNLFENRLVFSADWYMKKTDDILLEYDVLKEVGAANKISQNLGKVKNRGIEFVLTHNNKIGDFGYSISGNFSKNWNKVTYLGDGVKNLAPGMWITAVGQPIGTYYGYKTDGLLTEQDIASGKYISNGTTLKPGDVKYVDLDNSGTLNAEDRTFIGKDVPDITYGGSLSLSYKNFDLNIFGQGISGTSAYFTMENAHPFADNAPPREWHKKRWTEENPDPKAAYPRILPQGYSNYNFNTQNYSDFWLFDSDYFRIKNITLGYTFEKKVISRLGLSSLRLYMSSENPFTIRADKRMKDFDPETASERGNMVTGNRSYIFGVNLSF